MATTARASHVREPSITTLDCDVNPNFTFPPQPPARPQSTGLQFPPSASWANNDAGFALPPRRGSHPMTSTSISVSRPRSGPLDPMDKLDGGATTMYSCETGLPSPEPPADIACETLPNQPPQGKPKGRIVGDSVSPTVLNASVRLAAAPERTSRHSREASELLRVPMLDPKPDQENDQEPISPSKKAAPPPPGVARPRRGHAHRRSGAISSSDVWSLMNQSAPALPIPASKDASKGAQAGTQLGTSPGASPRLSISAPVSPKIPAVLALPAPAEPTSTRTVPDPGTLAERRQNRVSFIDQIELIPRPLNSETSSMTTVKGHGGTDSISTIIAASRPTSSGTPERTPSPTRRPNRTRSNSQNMVSPVAALRSLGIERPSTAGAILSSPLEPNPTSPIPPVPEIPSLKRPTVSSPALSNEPSQDDLNSTVKKTKSKRMHKKAKSEFSPTMVGEEFGESVTSPSSKKKKKRKKKVKNWAGTILSKGKLRQKGQRKSKRAPTPPLSRHGDDGPGEYEWIATSWNESYVVMPMSTSPVMDGHSVAVSGGVDSPIIDLDAALGPFKTPMSKPTMEDRRRRMHSSANRGSGSYYFHKRSESMPEMQLFALEEDEDRTMEDVFEEDEETEESSEEETEDEDDGPMSSTEGLGIAITSDMEIPFKHERIDGRRERRYSSGNRLSTSTIRIDTSLSKSLPSPELERSPRESPSSLKRKGIPADIITPSTSEQLSTSPSARSVVIHQPLDSPSTFHTASSNLNTPIYPDFPNDDASSCFNPYRDYLGEPGPEMRMSVDDIPSLTSSSSTATMNAAYSGMPSTPCNGDVPPPIGDGKEKKDKGKLKWSRVWGFWKTK